MAETGALTEAEIDALLDEQHAPVEHRPLRVPLAGVGNSPTVAREEQTRRRRVMAAMIAGGFGTEEIVEHFANQGDRAGLLPDGVTRAFAMSEHATRQLMQLVLASWVEEDQLLGPHRKRIAIRRTLAEIRAARAKSAFTAVAALENNLMKLEGTAAPVRVEHGLRLTGALLSVLGDISEEELRDLVSEEARRTDRVALPADTGVAPIQVGETRVSVPRR